ncbi:transglutaminase domain-containing protein [Casimicrobium huifangae]|uniref:transglutaminase domain-containing protein n=1 Tax=Casimicrobium huifangae TaxID=2591109 RepID=UPI0037846E34
MAIARSVARTIAAVACAVISLVVNLAHADPADSNDPRIRALATSLGNSPTTIFQYVRDNVGIEVYTGSLRGARGTLASKAGNSLDRASLLIALLKAANPAIEARYVQGTLSSTDAITLLVRMFSSPQRILGCDNPSPRVNGGELLGEVSQHYWVEYRVGSTGSFTTLDSAFPTATAGQSFAAAIQTFTTIATGARHQTRIRVEAETYSQASAMFGFGLATTTVLDRSFDSADLVDKPVSVSHFVNAYSPPSLAIGATQNTYTPYLTVGDSRLDISSYEVIRGTDYIELLTSFPLGNTLVTGVFVVIDITDASGQTQSFRRTMYDRIGYVTRAQGGNVNVDPQSFTRPVVAELDVMTVTISPSRQALDDFTARKTRLQNLQSALAALAPAVAVLPPVNLRDASQNATARTAIDLNRYALIATNEMAAASFLGAADRTLDEHSLRTLTRAYIASPRITIAQSRVKTNALALSLDIRKNDLRVLPLPGISSVNARTFENVRGMSESMAEGITAQNLGAANTLNLSAEAKLRIQDAVRAGRTVLAPLDAVTVGGVAVNAWVETDPNTGYTISTLEDGSHGAFAEYVFALLGVSFSNFEDLQAQFIGRVSAIGVFGVALMSATIQTIASNDAFSNIGANVNATLRSSIKGALAAIMAELELGELLQLKMEGGAGVVKNMVTGLLNGLEDMQKAFAGESGDPPLLRTLFSSAVPPLPADQPPGVNAGLTISAALDSRFSVAYAGAEFLSVYLVRAVNTGPQSDTFRFSATGGGSGMNMQDTYWELPTVSIRPGASFEFHACMRPQGALAASGTAVPFTISGASTTAPAVTASTSGSFTVAATKALDMRIAPGPDTALPGATRNLTLTLDSFGNSTTTAALTLTTTPGLSVTGLPASVTLAAGETRALALVATVGGGVLPGSDLSASVKADFGAAFLIRTTWTTTVTAAVAQCVAPATTSASRIGRASLAALLGSLTAQIGQLAAQPGSAELKQAVLSSLDNLQTQLNAPFLSALAAGFASAQTGVSNATAGNMGSALGTLDSQFCVLRDALNSAYNGAFRVTLAPSVTTSLPNIAAQIDITIFNDTALPRVMLLSATGVPAGVTATFNTARVLVPANYRTNGFLSPPTYVTFANNGTAQAFEYQITVTPEDDPASARSFTGQLSVRPEIVRVVSVTPTPAYASAGGNFAPTVRLLSAVNEARTVGIRYVVRDRNNVLTYSSPRVDATFASGDGVRDVALGSFGTTGYADGVYRIDVTVYDALETPIPGATGSGNIVVGQPFAATLAVNPSALAPGNSTVNLALTLDRSLLAQPNLQLRSTTALAGGASTVAKNGNYLYLCQSNQVRIVNVSNPSLPAVIGAFAGAQLGIGYQNVDCSTFNDKLYLGYDRGLTTDQSASRRVAIFDISGVNETNPVLLNPTPLDTGKRFGNKFTFAGSRAYMQTAIYYYNPFSQFIFEQHGNLLKFDFTTPVSPALSGELFHAFAPPATPLDNQPDSGGPHLAFGFAPVSPSRGLLASTTSSDGNFAAGVARLLAVDLDGLDSNCPGSSNPCILATVDVAQAKLFTGVGVQGSSAVAVGDTAGFYDALSGLTGNLVISAFDLSNPASPTLASTLVTGLVHNESQQCNPAQRVGPTRMVTLTNNYYAVGAYNAAACSWVLALIDANTPAQLRVIPYDVPDNIRDFVLDGNLLYAVTASSVLVFDYTSIVGPAVTASVVIPKGTGVSLVPGSFSLAPTTTVTDSSSDTYVWQQPSSSPITWQETVTAMQPGSSRNVVSSGSVAFTLPTVGSGTLSLAPVVVTSDHIVSLTPAESPLLHIGGIASHTITLTNPSASAPVTYALSVEGIPASWVKSLAPSVTVPAGGSASTVLQLQTPIATGSGRFPFRVVASTATGSDAAYGAFNNYYAADIGSETSAVVSSSTVSATPSPATAARGGTTAIRVRVNNTGTAVDRYWLTPNSYPGNWSMTLDPPEVFVQPGQSTDFFVTLALPASASTGLQNIAVNLVANFAVRSVVTVPVNVAGNGVTVGISPSSGTASTPYVATITNLGPASDIFDLALLGPLGPTVTASASSVTLAGGASTTVNLSVGDAAAFARPGSNRFDLRAISRAEASANATASATVNVPQRLAVSVTGQPANNTVSGPLPASRTVRAIVTNLGNVADSFNVSIAGTTGAVTAQLVNAAGNPVSVVGPLSAPAFGSLGLQVIATVSSAAPASVTVRATSTTDGNVTATGTIIFNAAPTCNLDIDGDGAVLATTDGLLILRNLLQLGGNALVNGAYNPNSTYGNLNDITTRLGVLNSNSWLDLDGNGTRDATTDGLLLLRALSGFTGNAVTNNALGAEPRTRNDWAAIRSYLNTTCGLGLP